MANEHVCIDINAHISDITYTISVSANAVNALISFVNISAKTITAIKFKATGYNSFGDVIPINGRDEFNLIIQDLRIDPNNHVVNRIRTKLPDMEIRKLKLEENQICYADGTVSTYLGRDEREYGVMGFVDTPESREVLTAIKARFGFMMQVQPREVDCGWICGCKRFNPAAATVCSGCRNEKAQIMQLADAAVLQTLVEEFREKQQHQRAAEQRATAQSTQNAKRRMARRRKRIRICLIVAALILLMAGGVYWKPDMGRIVVLLQAAWGKIREFYYALRAQI